MTVRTEALCAMLALFLAGCSGSAINLDGGTDAGTLQWYSTCGDPVCQTSEDGGLTNDAGVPCPAVGTTCAVLGQTCGTSNPHIDCGATDLCDDHDPKTICPL